MQGFTSKLASIARVGVLVIMIFNFSQGSLKNATRKWIFFQKQNKAACTSLDASDVTCGRGQLLGSPQVKMNGNCLSTEKLAVQFIRRTSLPHVMATPLFVESQAQCTCERVAAGEILRDSQRPAS